MCVCLSGSVYCEEVAPDMTNVPTLPKETGYLYARFNKIKKIRNKDFADMGKLSLTSVINFTESHKLNSVLLYPPRNVAEN